MAEIARVQLLPDIPVTLSHRPDFAAKKYISRETLFQSIGFEKISALDYSDFEGAEYIFNLNSHELPEALREQFDVVINHGTMEHVFHIPNCLANIHNMLRIGGRVIHSSPSSNFMDHGFYMFSPTFFYDYYSANKWSIHSVQVVRVDPKYQEVDAPFFADYEPGIFDRISSGGLDSGAYGTYCIMEKTVESTFAIIPQQGFYKRMGNWEANTPVSSFEEIRLLPPFDHDQGNCWTKDLKDFEIPSGDSGKASRKSSLKFTENGILLGPAHTIHDLIRSFGKGCYSHWGEMLYFSTSDNSDPNVNGRVYTIVVPAG
jgi:SAM-dependent methyltransferase